MICFLKNHKGFTLVEVLVSITILVLIVFVFVTLFSSSFANIFAFGEKNRAMALASDNMEALYALQPISSNEIKDFLENHYGNFVNDKESLYELHGKDKKFNFFIEANEPLEDVHGNKVTIVIFYKTGERHITLSSYIREA